MRNLFRKKSKEPDADQAMASLESMMNILTKKYEHAEKKMEEQREIATKWAKTDKRRAIAALKSSKMFQDQLVQIEGQLQSLQTQKNTLEAAATTIALASTMKVSNQAMKGMLKDHNAEEIGHLADEIQEQMDITSEISDAIAQVGQTQVYDEDELLQELQDMQQEELTTSLTTITPEIKALPELPAVSKSSPKKVEDDDEDLARQLHLWSQT